MWLFTRYGFYRVAWYGKEFAVCARTRFHLEALLRRFPHLVRVARSRAKSGRAGAPAAEDGIIEIPTADYRWRIMVPRKAWVAVVSELAEEQDWRKFKSEVERFNGHAEYYRACLEVWQIMYGFQLDDVNRDRNAAAEDRAEAAYDADAAMEAFYGERTVEPAEDDSLGVDRLPGWSDVPAGREVEP